MGNNCIRRVGDVAWILSNMLQLCRGFVLQAKSHKSVGPLFAIKVVEASLFSRVYKW